MIAMEIDSRGPVEALTVMSSNVGDMTEPIADVLKSALSDARLEVEASKGGLFGGSWQPMSLFTVNPPMILQKLGVMHPREPGTLLFGSGALAASLEPGGMGNILQASAAEGTAGTSLGEASLMQEGTSRVFDVLHFFTSHGERREFIEPGIPARPFLGWHEERFPDYDAIFGKRIFQGIGAEAR